MSMTLPAGGKVCSKKPKTKDIEKAVQQFPLRKLSGGPTVNI